MKRGTVLGVAAVTIWVIVQSMKTPRPAGGEDPGRFSSKTPMVEVLEPLDTEVLVRRSLETFPSGYLNTISIIQGVALASLVTQTFGILLRPQVAPDENIHFVTVIVESLFLFIGIVIVAYEYLWFLTVIRWTPTFRDTLVPMVLGVSEIVPQFFLGGGATWWGSVSVFTFVGAIAFCNTIDRLTCDLFGEYSPAFHEIRRVLWKLVVCCLSLTAAEVAMAMLSSHRLSPLVPLIAMGLLALSAAVVVHVSERALDRVYGYLNVDRRPGRRWSKRRNVRS